MQAFLHVELRARLQGGKSAPSGEPGREDHEVRARAIDGGGDEQRFDAEIGERGPADRLDRKSVV